MHVICRRPDRGFDLVTQIGGLVAANGGERSSTPRGVLSPPLSALAYSDLGVSLDGKIDRDNEALCFECGGRKLDKRAGSFKESVSGLAKAFSLRGWGLVVA